MDPGLGEEITAREYEAKKREQREIDDRRYLVARCSHGKISGRGDENQEEHSNDTVETTEDNVGIHGIHIMPGLFTCSQISPNRTERKSN